MASLTQIENKDHGSEASEAHTLRSFFEMLRRCVHRVAVVVVL